MYIYFCMYKVCLKKYKHFMYFNERERERDEREKEGKKKKGIRKKQRDKEGNK